MNIVISTQLRKRLMQTYAIDKCELSKILHFRLNSNRARRVRCDILNFHNYLIEDGKD